MPNEMTPEQVERIKQSLRLLHAAFGEIAEQALQAMQKIKTVTEMLTFTCPRCGMVSANLDDVREGYCGNCHDFTGRKHGEAEG